MKILRKRVGSLEIDDFSKIRVLNDSIFHDDKIIFNYLPIKNLSFFSLKLDKSNIGSKYWIFLDLNLNFLYKELLNGKIITSRDLIFDMIISSLNRLKIANRTIDSINIKSIKLEDINNDEDYKLDNVYCFENKFVKYGKVYFDIKRKLLTIEKCKKRRIKLPSIIIFNNYHQIKSTVISLLQNCKIENTNSLFIISKKDTAILNSKVFNPYFKDKIQKIVYSEDLNYQMENYLKEIGNNEFLSQLEFESSNFFYSKQNIFILANNLTEISINYITFCSFEKLFFLNFRNIEDILYKLTYNYDKYRISKSDKFNNYLISNFILSKKIFFIEDSYNNIKYTDIKINSFPYINWKKNTDKHFLTLDKSNKLMSNFVKIGINNDWSESYIQNLKKLIKPSDNNCPISLSELDSFSVITECSHCFNLKNILKWLMENRECPICRKNIYLENMRFINNPDFSIFIKSLSPNLKILIICDSLWFEKFQNDKLINKKKTNIKIIHQSSFIDGSFLKDKNLKNSKENKSIIVNLSGLTDKDIMFVGKMLDFSESLEIANLLNE